RVQHHQQRVLAHRAHILGGVLVQFHHHCPRTAFPLAGGTGVKLVAPTRRKVVFDRRCHGSSSQCSRTMVARPRKVKKPIESVTAVRKMPLASAGSKPKRFRPRGTSTPASAANNRLQVSAMAITAE